MKSVGLPYDHIVCAMLYLDFDEIPKSLVLTRWTKFAKESISGRYPGGSLYWDTQVAGRYASLVKLAKDVVEMAYEQLDEYNCMVDVLNIEYNRLKDKNADGQGNVPSVLNTQRLGRSVNENVLDPVGGRPKGCGTNPACTPHVRRCPLLVAKVVC